eukprot:49405_1
MTNINNDVTDPLGDGFVYPEMNDPLEYIQKQIFYNEMTKLGDLFLNDDNPMDTIRKYKKLHMRIHRTDETSQTFEEQLHKMWELSNKTGDTKILVKIQNNDDLDSYDLYAPPHKKVRIDTSNNSNNNRNNNSNNNNESLDEDEDNEHNCVILCHGSTLRSASVVFDRMLETNMKEKQEKKIIIYAKDKKDVEDLIYFMCTNILREGSNALNLVHMSHYYEMDRLFTECLNKLVEDISVKNYV